MPASAPMSAALRRAWPARAFSALDARPRAERAGARGGARRAQGPDHEGGAAARHHPRCAAAGIRHRADQAAKPGAADGLGLRQAPHEGRARAPTGRRSSQSFEHQPAAAASLGQVHRATRARRRGARLQAAISRHAVGGRSRSAAAAAGCSRIHRRMDPAIDTTEIGKEIGARMREELDYRREAKHVALYRAMLDGQRSHPRAERLAGALDRPAAHARLARGHAGCSSTRTRRSPCATASRTAMFTAWWFPFSRFGVIHGDPHLGNYTVFDEDEGRAAPASTCSTTAASASSRRASSAAWSISTAACARRRRPRRARLRDLGLQAAQRAN